ncbi:hypothetical protein AB1Y20_020809 [Prymnesium parvum]|mmetsp:Transcript_31486/g.76576  ORF Transcript_31486/g.76576 Transcript_31486/m.76576 type:complete len:273 (+) Transcript_31486:45-863(+)
MRIVGHRGASAVRPENTLSAFRHALDVCGAFEMDLQLTKTGEVLILHDETLRRTAKLKSFHNLPPDLLDTPVINLPLDAVQACEVGSWLSLEWAEEEAPLFCSALSLLRTSTADPHTFAELKADTDDVESSYDRMLPTAAESDVRKLGVTPQQLTWITFSRPLAMEMKERMPEYRVLLIGHAHSLEEAWTFARACVDSNLDGVDLNAGDVVTKELVTWLHERGKTVAVWVYRAPAVNDVEAVWDAMKLAGVDAFTSNLPDNIHKWTASFGQA